ncbi:MAG: hypothetical protein ACTTHU_03885 [Treponema sp.]
MIEIILALIVICIAIALIKKIGGILLTIVGIVLRLAWYIFAIVPIIFTKFFEILSRILHIRRFSYYLLGIMSIPSFIYLCKVYAPYSKMEKFVDIKELFTERRKKREHALAMSCFLTLFSVALACIYISDCF